MEGALPACLVEDVDEDVAHEAETFADGLLVDLVGRGFKGPVDEHGAAYDVFARDKSPKTAVEAFGAVVTHGKDFAGRDDEVAVNDVIGEIVAPACGDLVIGARGDGRKVVAIGVEGVLRVTIVGGHAGLGSFWGAPFRETTPLRRWIRSPGMPMVRLTRKRSGSPGLKKTMMSPRRTSR